MKNSSAEFPPRLLRRPNGPWPRAWPATIPLHSQDPPPLSTRSRQGCGE